MCTVCKPVTSDSACRIDLVASHPVTWLRTGNTPIRIEPRKAARHAHDRENTMRRKGTIAIIDPDQGAAAILTAESGYTIVELDPDWPVDIGDRIEWENGEALGFETYENISKGTRGDVFVQNHEITEQALRLQFGH
jgi:hypothetical protein